jgi:hypothetical protein
MLNQAFVWQAAEAYLVNLFEVKSSNFRQRVAGLTFCIDYIGQKPLRHPREARHHNVE